jgi:predicted nucleic acid-binding protein
MKPQPAFFDASALVPLCVREATSRQAQAHLRHSLPVVWWGTPVEIHSALAHLHRMAVLSDRERKGALARLELLSRGWREILPTDSVRELARQLLDTHQLRASDSLQLAAALTWCHQQPRNRDFVSGDQQLSQAAAAAGFTVLALSP